MAALGAFLLLANGETRAMDQDVYLPGGPLAGVPLKPNPQATPARGVAYGEVELYPDSVEHWRAYWMKYTPKRSMFDVQSQLRNFTAAQLARQAGVVTELYAQPVYRVGRESTEGPTGDTREPVAVLRATPEMAPLVMDMGHHGPGMFVLRIVGAVQTERLRPFREPLFVTWRVNDGPEGAFNTYRRRLGYVDEFYSVEELYFHLGTPRELKVELAMDPQSRVDLLIANVILDDVLAGVEVRPIKTRQTLTDPQAYIMARATVTDENRAQWLRSHGVPEAMLELDEADRLARDEALWRRLLPVQHQFWNHGFQDLESRLRPSTPQLDADAFEEAFGQWSGDTLRERVGPNLYDPAQYNDFLINRQLGLTYSLDDAWNFRPLPEPYPYPDPAGYYWVDPENPEKGHVVAPIPMAIYWQALRVAPGRISQNVERWMQSGEELFARDAAVQLIRYAYNFPAYDFGQALPSFLTTPSFRGRDTRFRQRHYFWPVGEYTGYMGAIESYDRLFPYIAGNEDLARSIGRFVPWVKTSDDVIALLDAYLVQMTAKRTMRYHYRTINTAIATLAATLADPQITEPWMVQWFGTRAFVYPNPLAGFQDLTISGMDRSGISLIGSTFYATDRRAIDAALATEVYRQAVPDTQFNLADPDRFPKQMASVDWTFATIVGGHDFMRIGNVTGPEKQPGRTIPAVGRGGAVALAWQWTQDPRYAWILVHTLGRTTQDDEQWQAIEAAAATVARAPWLENRSRFIPNWAGVLETGHEHDDWRFRRAAYVRTGMGSGHAHHDTLDLQLFAHGIAWMPDDGQRSGYSKPNSARTRVHNLVEVDGADFSGYAWTSSLSDAPGARYLLARARHPVARDFHRQVALIDVDVDLPVQKRTPEQMQYNVSLPAVEQTPNSYVFDVFRVDGGNLHTYAIHGLGDDFTWNARQVTAPLPQNPEHAYLSMFDASEAGWRVGDAPSTLQAQWVIPRNEQKNWEQSMMQRAYDPALPAPVQRVHLLEAQGMRALYADIVCNQLNYVMGNVMLQRRGEDLSTAFAAIIEPFRGEPFIREVSALEVPDNENDALRAVAVRVQTTHGHDDMLFADGRPDKTRQVADLRVSGAFAYLSRDSQGVRQASLTGGTLLEAPGIRIETAQRQRTGTILEVDYLARTFRIDTRWPAGGQGQLIEVGNADKTTAYTIAQVIEQPVGSLIQVTQGADMYRSQITQVLPESNRVDAVLTSGNFAGLTGGMTASNEDMTRFWKVRHVQGNDFTLDGPVRREDFAPADVLRVWEYGVGDTVRQETFVTVHRLANGAYEVQGNVDAQVTVNGQSYVLRVAP